MRSHQLTLGRAFGVAFDDGEDFVEALNDFCRSNGVVQGYLPMFLAGFREAEIVGTCEKLNDPRAPVWSAVHLENVEALGCGTIAYDEEAGQILPHVHTTLGQKGHSATGFTSHLLSAEVQFLVEMVVVEVTAPRLRRSPNPDLYNVPLLTFETDGKNFHS